jgi:hypothetical protein
MWGFHRVRLGAARRIRLDEAFVASKSWLLSPRLPGGGTWLDFFDPIVSESVKKEMMASFQRPTDPRRSASRDCPRPRGLFSHSPRLLAGLAHFYPLLGHVDDVENMT